MDPLTNGFGSGSGSIPLTNESGFGRPKNMWIRWIRIRNTLGYRTYLPCFQVRIQARGCLCTSHRRRIPASPPSPPRPTTSTCTTCTATTSTPTTTYHHTRISPTTRSTTATASPTQPPTLLARQTSMALPAAGGILSIRSECQKIHFQSFKIISSK
jgi:hypothetical protein